MSKRGKLGALAGAFVLTFAVVGAAIAAPKEGSVDVTKTASVATVPAGGGSVTYTVKVTNTGDKDFHALTVSDSKCTLTGGKAVSGGNKFASGEVLTYTCTLTVAPNTTNTATAWACTNSSDCNQESASATDSASVTVGLTAAPAAAAPTPTKKVVAPATSTTSLVSSSADGAWLLIIALGVLLASVVILTPRRSKSSE
ncbi:MAG TPA: hypothetical protein VEX41_04620 [Candidatus Eisenbacteria bacterium]|nr:hypothetical protein [Candidatus Eisenbacteria bacterium]